MQKSKPSAANTLGKPTSLEHFEPMNRHDLNDSHPGLHWEAVSHRVYPFQPPMKSFQRVGPKNDSIISIQY